VQGAIKSKMINQKVIDEIRRRINLHHELYDTKVSSTFWEEIYSKSLAACGEENDWKPDNSHRKGMDVEKKDGFKISCKSGTIEGKKEPRLVVSSHRTTTYNTIEEKVKFLSENHQDLIISLVEIGEKRYKIFIYESPDVSSLNWCETKSGWAAENELGLYKIQRKMSDQFWFEYKLSKSQEWCYYEVDL